MNQEIAKTLRLWLTLMVLCIFSGIYVGATSVRNIQKDEMAYNQRVSLNCLEVIIGKRPKGRVCQK